MHRLLRNNIWFRFWMTIIRPVVRSWLQLDRSTSGLLGRIVRAIYRFTQYGPHEAAALSYYALFSLFPLLILTIVLSATVLGPAAASDQIRDILLIFFPGETADVVQDAVTAALNERESASIFAIIVLGWSSANLFGNLEKVLSAVFGIQTSRRIYERRLIGVVIILILSVLLLASVITNLIFGLLGLFYLNQGNTWLRMASLFVPTAFNAAIFATLYGFVTRVRLRWDAILPASLLGGLAFEFAKMGFVWYLGNLGDLSLVYGSVTAVVVFMLWAFIIFCLVLIGAEICRALDDWMEDTSDHPDEEEEFQQLIASTTPQHVLPPPE